MSESNKRPVAVLEAAPEVPKKKRGRKKKETNYNEELIKPIVNGIIKEATKKSKKETTPNPTVELVRPIVNGLIKEATKPQKKKKAKKNDDDEDFIVKPIVGGIIKGSF